MATDPGQTPGQLSASNIVLGLGQNNQFLGLGRVSIAPPEDPVERDARLKREAEEARHRRWLETGMIVVITLGLIGICIVCVQIMLDQNAPADTKEWAKPIITAIVSGAIGFATGRSSK